MQAVLGEAWWSKKKRKLQDDLEKKRRHEEEDRMADVNRLEAMRQRRIKRKMGACKYHCWPCGRSSYDKMFPKAYDPPVDPEAEEAERLRKVWPTRPSDRVFTARTHLDRSRVVMLFDAGHVCFRNPIM